MKDVGEAVEVYDQMSAPPRPRNELEEAFKAGIPRLNVWDLVAVGDEVVGTARVPQWGLVGRVSLVTKSTNPSGAGFVVDWPDGKRIFYSLNPDDLRYPAKLLTMLTDKVVTLPAPSQEESALRQQLDSCLTLRPLEEWDEEMGDVLWWNLPITQPPYCGVPGDDGWPGSGWATHFTRFLVPKQPGPEKSSK